MPELLGRGVGEGLRLGLRELHRQQPFGVGLDSTAFTSCSLRQIHVKARLTKCHYNSFRHRSDQCSLTSQISKFLF